MKSIAFVSENQDWGGSEELWSQTAKRMKDQGQEIRIFTLPKLLGNKKLQDLKSRGCQLFQTYEIAKPPFRKFIDRFLPSRYRFYPFVDGKAALLKDFKPDLVVISLGFSQDSIHWMETCIQKNIPFVIIVHLVAESAWPDDLTAQVLINNFTKAKRCFFVSQANLDLFNRQIGYELQNVELAINPFQVAYSNKIAYLANLDGLFKLAIVARIGIYHKGHDLLIQVLQLEKWKQRPIELTVFGSGNNIEVFKRLVQLSRLENIKLGGFNTDISTIWSTHHALILPSRIEGMPLTVVEAMLCSRVCIVTDVGGNAELIDDNINGFIAKAPTVELLDEAMERAWQRRYEWEEIGKLACKKVKSKIPEDPIKFFVQRLTELITK